MSVNEEKKNGRHRIRFNIFDVVLILLAILCIVGIWQRKNLQNLFSSERGQEAYTVTFEIAIVRKETADCLKVGTELYMDHEGERLAVGTLSQASTGAATVYLQDAMGETVTAIYHPNDFRSVRGVLDSRGIEHDGAFLLGGKLHMAVNQSLTVYTENADFEIRIIGIQKVA